MENQPDPNRQIDPFEMTLGNLKFALATLEEEREKRSRMPGTRYIAIAITDLEKLIAYAEKYLTPEYL